MKANHCLPLLGVLVLLLASTRAQGQVVRYRNLGNARLQTAAEMDTFRQEMNRRGQSAGIEFRPRISNTITRPDTIIYEYTLFGTQTPAAILARKQYLASFVGKPLPAFALPDLRGKLVSSKGLLGQPLVLNLWFTSCGPCIAEMPVLNRIQQEKAHAGTVFLALTFESREKVQAFLKKQSFTFRHLVDAKSYCQQFTAGYPITLFVDRSGTIRNVLGAIPVTYDAKTEQPLGADDQEFYAALRQIE